MKTMKPRRSPERAPSFSSTDEQPPRWPWEQPPTPEEADVKEEPPKPQSDQKKSSGKEKNEKPVTKSPEQTPRAKTEKEQNEQERRVTLLERSLELTKKFEEAPIPNDPHTVARLMIAKRVVAVNEQLETPPAERTESDEVKLLATLDYLGDLSDKFDDPDSESSPEINEAYKTILHLAAEALEEEEPEVLVEQVDGLDQLLVEEPPSLDPQPTPSPATPAPVSPLPTDRPKTRINLASLPIKTIALFKLLIPKRQRIPTNQTELPKADSEQVGYSPKQPEATYTDRDSISPTAPERFRTESHHIPLSFRHSAKKEHFPGRSLPVIAPIILGALALGTRSSSPSSTEIHRPITASPEGSHYHGPVSHSYEQPIHPEQHREAHVAPAPPRHELHESPSAELLARPAHELQKMTTAPEVVHASLSAQKFEFMSLHTLLDAATHVSIGHGDYLRRAYEKGQIDKAGLISVLKANAKGRDFIAEYRHQADRTRRLRITSPEFLHHQPTSPTDTSSTSETTTQQATTVTDRHSPPDSATPAPRSSSESVSQTLDMLKTEKKQAQHQTWPNGAHPMTGVWIAIGVVATMIVALITVLILTII
jgi:hypothetical protein